MLTQKVKAKIHAKKVVLPFPIFISFFYFTVEDCARE